MVEATEDLRGRHLMKRIEWKEGEVLDVVQIPDDKVGLTAGTVTQLYNLKEYHYLFSKR